MVGYWPLNDGSGTTAYDQSGFGDNGTWNGSDGHWTTNAGLFTAPTDYISVPSQSQLNTGAKVTVTAWIKTTNASFNGLIAGKSIWWDSNDYELNKDQDTGGDFNVNGNSHSGWSAGSFTTNTWYFLAGTYDGTTMDYYVNGTLEGSVVHAGTLLSNTDAFLMGGNISGGNFTGAINNVRVYNRVLSGTEITALYTAGK